MTDWIISEESLKEILQEMWTIERRMAQMHRKVVASFEQEEEEKRDLTSWNNAKPELTFVKKI